MEENVKAGVRVLRANPNVITAEKERGLKVHGCVYDIGTGLVKELRVEIDEDEEKARMEAYETS